MIDTVTLMHSKVANNVQWHAEIDSDLTFRLSCWIKSTTVTFVGELDSAVRSYRVESGSIPRFTDFELAALASIPSDEWQIIDTRFERFFVRNDIHDYVKVRALGEQHFIAKRLIRPPVHLTQISIESENIRSGMHAAHKWAGYGPRVITVPEDSRPDPLDLLEASTYGIGVERSSTGETLVPSAPYRPRRLTAARWKFAERLYGLTTELSQ